MNRMPIVPLALLLAFAASPGAARVKDPSVDRAKPTMLTVRWTDAAPVDVYTVSTPDGGIAAAKRVASGISTGQFTIPAADHDRPYFLLRDTLDGSVVRVAERLVPLEQGSNFRDLGGYPAAGGKHVRWGVLFRSGATPLLSDADVAELKTLNLRQLVDLRSSEERVLAPTRIEGVPYAAVGYSMRSINTSAGAGAKPDMEAVYRNFPGALAPQMRVLFQSLLMEDAPIAYNCSAGQDRTGFATALILTALGVPRETIFADYHLSTTYRRPEFEMPPIDLAQHPGDPAAEMFARSQAVHRKPQPLMTTDGKAYLAFAFDELDKKWGSPEAYLRKEAGIGPQEIARLRAMYLE